MSLYLITLLSNLNFLSFIIVLGSVLVFMWGILEARDMSVLQRRLAFLLALALFVMGLLWIVFAPNSALLREWAKEYGYDTIDIPCLTCKD